jgi:hypothetical protein
MIKRFVLYLFLLITAGILLSSCKKDDENQTQDARINFQMMHYVGNETVEFDNIKYTNSFGNLYSVSRLQYFISDFRLEKADGSEVFMDEEFYVDGMVENTTVLTPQEKIPSGDYSSISFIFGLSEEKNVSGAFPNPPENNMEWPPTLGSGYHYMKLEGKTDSSGTVNNFQAHTGPTNGNQNFIEVTLPGSAFTVSGNEVTLFIKMDINKWWEGPNLFDLNQMTMMMGNQEIQEKLKENGGDVFSFEIPVTIN